MTMPTMMMVTTRTMLMETMFIMVMLMTTIVSGRCPAVVNKIVSGRGTAINRVGPKRLHQTLGV